jgi:phosphorylase superfamily
LCLTGDQFLDDPSVTQKLRAETNADVVEMEAFAFASAAREF